MNNNLLKFQFITSETEKYSHIDGAKIAIDAGFKWIQLRMKNVALNEIEKTAAEIKELCDKNNVILIINDHPEICKKINASGIHLGKMDMKPVEARRLLSLENYEKKFIIGGTANNLDDIMELALQDVDYIGLGPFRFTSTKANLSPLLGLEKYVNITEQCRNYNIQTPIIAIGGITKNDIHPLMKIRGIAGIALSSAILNAENPQKEAKEIVGFMNKN